MDVKVFSSVTEWSAIARERIRVLLPMFFAVMGKKNEKDW